MDTRNLFGLTSVVAIAAGIYFWSAAGGAGVNSVSAGTTSDRQTITVTGQYIARASGIGCAQFRKSDGETVSLYSLPATVPLNAHLRVKGYMGEHINCGEAVLYVTSHDVLQD